MKLITAEVLVPKMIVSIVLFSSAAEIRRGGVFSSIAGGVVLGRVDSLTWGSFEGVVLLLLLSASLSDNFLETGNFLAVGLPIEDPPLFIYFLVGDGEFLPMDPVRETVDLLVEVGVLSELLVDALDGVRERSLRLEATEPFGDFFKPLVGSFALNCDLPVPAAAVGTVIAPKLALTLGVGFRTGRWMIPAGSGVAGFELGAGRTLSAPPPNILMRSLMGVLLEFVIRGADISINAFK